MGQTGGAIVVGLGNPILSDDGIGWRVAGAVETLLAKGNFSPAARTISVRRVCAGGLALAEALVGYEDAVIVDAILVPGGTPGAVHRFGLGDLPASLNTSSSHDLTLSAAIQLLRSLGAHVPADQAIRVVAIEVEDVWTFGEVCSASVEASVVTATRAVLDILAEVGLRLVESTRASRSRRGSPMRSKGSQ